MALNTMMERAGTARRVVARVFGETVGPILTGFLFAQLRIGVWWGQQLDKLFFPQLAKTKVQRPIVIVGNPRTGTTFLQRFLHDNGVGAGQELWRMLYPSLTMQVFLKPLLPLLEKISPAKHHSTAAHETSLTGVETDDVSVFFRYFDGFFLYGFLLAWDPDEDHEPQFDPATRDTAERDYAWLDELWRRNLVATGAERNVAKLFSLAPRLPSFLNAYPDASILFMARDPMSVLPSAMSLVTGVLDKKFGFWSLPDDVRLRWTERLYKALVKLFLRFTEDWNSGKIDKSKVFVVRFDRLMGDFEGLMTELLEFVGHDPSPELIAAIKARDEKQKAYKSKHTYDLARFNLDEERIRKDCAPFYETFLS